ncbi:MAG: hypothetical protein IKR61_04940 [Lachnospiraceae bacterium]|nr:hypothetical protein [Lachnospiraceae bacterium]
MDKFLAFWGKYYRRIFYAAGAFGILWIDVVRGNGSGAQWELASNLTGLCILPMIVTRFSPQGKTGRQSAKWLYFVWLAIALIGGAFFYDAFSVGTDYDAGLLAAVIEAAVYGFVLIRVWQEIFSGEAGGTFRPLTVAFWIWLSMIAWSILSRNASVWPLWFLVMFGALYLLPAERERDLELFRGIVDGMLLGFFWIQGRALLYRPYDMVRYHGYFYNSNNNAIFYFTAYAAALARFSDLRRGLARSMAAVGNKVPAGKKTDGKIKWMDHPKEVRRIMIRMSLLFFLQAMICDLVMLSLSRGTMLTVVLVTAVYWLGEELYFWKRSREGEAYFVFDAPIRHWAAGWVLRGVTLFAVLCFCFPLVYGGVRVLPALRHHPIWFADEYNENKSWRSFDGFHSDRFISLEEYFEGLIGRIRSEDTDETLQYYMSGEMSALPAAEDSLGVQNSQEEQGSVLVVRAAELGKAGAADADSLLSGTGDGTPVADTPAPGADADHPIYDKLPSYRLESVLGIRAQIYAYYLSRLNLLGHAERFSTVWLTSNFQLRHAHNVYLQMAYNYGIPAGLLLLALNLLAVGMSWRRREDPFAVFAFCIQLGFFLIGLTENPLFLGRSLLTLFFVTLLPLMRKKRSDAEKSG